MGGSEFGRVIVVGAGPVGVVAAMAAARRGFDVTVLEAAEQVEEDPRASTFHPSTLEMIHSLGDDLFEEFVAAGLVARYFDFWDKPNRSLVARMDHQVLAQDTPFPFVVQTEQHKLTRMGLRRLDALRHVEVRLGAALASVEQAQDKVTAITANGERVEAEWLIGCDGGRSTVRKSQGIEFEGFTWPERFVVLTTLFDFAEALSCAERSYFADPQEWTNLFKVAGEDLQGRWRVVFPTAVEESDEQALSDEAAALRLGRVWPEAAELAPVHRKLYRVHQRVAQRFRAHRVFLAGDAAHVNNPIGGLGLNTGIHDALELVATLEEVSRGADADLLDRYERRRRPLNMRYVQEQTVANKRRLEESDPAAREAHLDELRAISEDPARMRAFLRRTSLLESVSESQGID
jgi:3-(3-hydroxy-phenyl)propionate hydroxylase